MRPFPPPIRDALKREGESLTVLVIRLGALGDIVRTLPSVRLLRRGLPRSKLVWVTEDRWRGVLDGHADLDGVIAMPRRRWRELAGSARRWPELLGSFAEFRRELRATGAGLVLDFHGNLRSGLTARLSGSPVRLGYAGHQQKEGNHWLTTHRVAPGGRRTPRMERNLDLVRALDLPDGPLPDAGLPLVERGRQAAARIRREQIGESLPYAVLSPGASVDQAYKKPPAELLAAAARALEGRGIRALVVWGPGEEPDARRAIAASGGLARYAPPTDLAALSALLATARLFVGGDSGPMHLACGVGCPTLALYGPTDPQVNRPWGVAHRALFPEGRVYTGIKRRDRDAGGFEGLSAERVARAVELLLDETG